MYLAFKLLLDGAGRGGEFQAKGHAPLLDEEVLDKPAGDDVLAEIGVDDGTQGIENLVLLWGGGRSLWRVVSCSAVLVQRACVARVRMVRRVGAGRRCVGGACKILVGVRITLDGRACARVSLPRCMALDAPVTRVLPHASAKIQCAVCDETLRML